ncbi:MAG: TIGR03086 family metal-binding protein [Pseudonocardiaceae bacterium]
MSEIADRYRSLAAGFTKRVESVPEHRWESASPCEGWTARELMAHMVETSARFFRLIARELPAGPTVDEDTAGAWSTARDAVQAALDDPAVATLEYEGFSGRTTFEQGINNFICFDVLVHTWDLARATGLDERLDPAEVHHVFEVAQPMDEMLRTPGVCGPKLDPPPGADEQARLLAFLGRAV